MSVARVAKERLSDAVVQNGSLSQTGVLERLFSRLFRGLVYAQIWEDPVCDIKGLDIQKGDSLVCITSGSCNMMSYLTAEPGSILTVDLSPAHTALARLKLASAQHLTQPQFYDLFGHANKPSNVALYRSHVAPHLDAQSRDYWEGRHVLRPRISMLARGFYRFGLLGRFLWIAHVLSRMGGVDFKPLLEAKSLSEQREFYEREIEPQFERPIIRYLARRRASLFGLGIPPAQYDKLAADGGGDVLPVLRERTRKLICDFPVNENYFVWAAFNRRYKEDGTGPVPPYLEAGNFETVKSHAGSVRAVNRSLTEALADEPVASKNGFVLLDAQDWMTDEQLNALWSEITRTAADGARVLFRTGGKENILPGRLRTDILKRWEYQEDLSAELSREDRSAIYGATHVYLFRG